MIYVASLGTKHPWRMWLCRICFGLWSDTTNMALKWACGVVRLSVIVEIFGETGLKEHKVSLEEEMAVRLFQLSVAKRDLSCNMPSEMKLGAKQNWGTTAFMRREGQRELWDSVQILMTLPYVMQSLSTSVWGYSEDCVWAENEIKPVQLSLFVVIACCRKTVFLFFLWPFSGPSTKRMWRKIRK